MSGHIPRIPIIALTGGIGSGKSAVADYFRKQDALVIVADDIAKEILWSDKNIQNEVIHEFGEQIVDEHRVILKQKLADAAFKDQESVARLNRIIHPRVIESIDRKISESTEGTLYRMVVVEAALIFEAGMENMFDYIVAVTANEGTKLTRIAKRDGLSEEAIRKRMELQLRSHETESKSDFIIDNNSTFAQLEKQTLDVIDQIIDRYY